MFIFFCFPNVHATWPAYVNIPPHHILPSLISWTSTCELAVTLFFGRYFVSSKVTYVSSLEQERKRKKGGGEEGEEKEEGGESGCRRDILLGYPGSPGLLDLLERFLVAAKFPDHCVLVWSG